MESATTSEPELCSACRTLDFGAMGIQEFNYEDVLENLPDRPLRNVFKSAERCFFCRMIIEYFKAWAEEEYGGIQALAVKENKARISIQYEDLFSLEDSESDNEHSKHAVRVCICYYVRLLGSSNDTWIGPQMCFQKCPALLPNVEQVCDVFQGPEWPQVEPYVSRLRPQLVDTRLFKKWKDTCAAYHDGDLCDAEYGGGPLDLIRLIDTRLDCLVELTADEITGGRIKWVALSYVWGKKRFPTLKKDNLNSWTKPGALTAASVPDIPDTICDAISVARNMGEQYLWVDSLCIIQDSPEDKQKFIQRMDAIYYLASLTIVNTAGKDAYHGLPGMRPSSRRRVQTSFRLGGVELVQTLDPPGNGQDLGYLGGCVWTTRGWTFQEGLLSRRLLIFTEEQAYWQCSTATWCEDSCWEVAHISDAPRIRREALADVDVANLWRPEVERFEKNYRAIVQRYSERQLTNQQDGLAAFAGIASALERAAAVGTTRRFVWGMPETFLGTALAWPCRRDGMRRRTDVCDVRLGGDLMVATRFPSWAWVGWIGPVYYGEAFGYLDCRHAGLVFHVLGSDGSVRSPPQNQQFRVFDDHPTDPKKLMPNCRWMGEVTFVGENDIPQPLKRTDIAPTVLAFYTSYARLKMGLSKLSSRLMAAIGRNNRGRQTYDQPKVSDRHGRDMKAVWFHRPDFAAAGRNPLPGEGQFIVIGRDTRESIREETRLCLLLVEEDADISGPALQRVGMLHVSEQAWNEVESREWRLVFLT